MMRKAYAHDGYLHHSSSRTAGGHREAQRDSDECGKFEHELFVVHAEADAPFVLGHLLPAVGLGPEQVLLSTALALGAPKIAEIERGCRGAGSQSWC